MSLNLYHASPHPPRDRGDWLHAARQGRKPTYYCVRGLRVSSKLLNIFIGCFSEHGVGKHNENVGPFMSYASNDI